MEILCSICTEPLFSDKVIVTTSCHHVFHEGCIEDWLKRSNTCPECRTEIQMKDSHRLYFSMEPSDHTVTKYMKQILKMRDEKEQMRREFEQQALAEMEIRSQMNEELKRYKRKSSKESNPKVATNNAREPTTKVISIKPLMKPVSSAGTSSALPGTSTLLDSSENPLSSTLPLKSQAPLQAGSSKSLTDVSNLVKSLSSALADLQPSTSQVMKSSSSLTQKVGRSTPLQVISLSNLSAPVKQTIPLKDVVICSSSESVGALKQSSSFTMKTRRSSQKTNSQENSAVPGKHQSKSVVGIWPSNEIITIMSDSDPESIAPSPKKLKSS